MSGVGRLVQPAELAQQAEGVTIEPLARQSMNDGGTKSYDSAPGCLMDTDFVKKLRVVRDTLTEGLVERDVAVRLGLLASLAGEHMLVLGPPGTAKSLIARRIHLVFDGATYFERLLTRFSVPEELFGPLSIKGLEEDRYERLTEAYLPKASVAFLDEIFKANSAILNSLLTLLNEREFDNGTVREKTPLVAVIGASNELPEGEELEALFDRFLLRLQVGPVTKEALRTLLGLRGQVTPLFPDELKLHDHELRTVREAADAVEMPEDVVALLCDLRDWCTAEQIQVSDRRWRKVARLLQVSAATNGRSRVSIWDCWLLQHCLWDTPEAREKVFEWYSTRVGASGAVDPSRLTKIVVCWEATLQADQCARSQMRDSSGAPLFQDLNGGHTLEACVQAPARRGQAPLFLAPAGAYARGGRFNLDQVHDRTNGGRGYTREDLDTFAIEDPYNGAAIGFLYWSGRDRYLADQSNWLMEDIDLKPVLEPTRHKEFYIDQCVADMDALRSDVEDYRDQLVMHIESLETEIREHLWVTPDFAEPAARSLEQTRHEVDTLLIRVTKLRDGFESLPRERAPEHSAAGGGRKKAKAKRGL